MNEVKTTGDTQTITQRYLDKDGSALLGPEGCAAVVTVYENGKLTTKAYFAADGSKVVAQGHYHRMENTYDEKGRLVRVDYYGAEDERIIASVGYASSVMLYDDLNRVVETDYLGKDGELHKLLDGYAKFTNEYYQGSDKVHFIRYFGADNERTMTKKGYSMVEKEYSGDDFDYRETYYDIVDEYTMSNDGYARIEWKFHRVKTTGDNGEDLWVIRPDQVERERFFGTNMQLIQIKAGFAGLVNERNENEQIIRTTYYNTSWQPTRNEETQYASIEFRYKGTSVADPAVYEAYFDETGRPCEGINGAYARTMVYGGPHNSLLLEEAFFTADGKNDTNVLNNAHRVAYSYNGTLMQTGVRYYGMDDKLYESRTGAAAVLREYTQGGSLLWEASFGTDGSLVTVGGQYAAQVHTYDHSGHHTGEKYYDASGIALTQTAGYASVTYAYDINGDITGICYFNSEDEPTLVNGRARVERAYDGMHHMVYEANFGADGKPIMLSEGYSARKLAYDPILGTATRVDYLGLNGEQILLPAGYAAYEVKYDADGNLLRRAYYGVHNEPVSPASVGYAWFERKLDGRGRILEEAYYNADGTPPGKPR